MSKSKQRRRARAQRQTADTPRCPACNSPAMLQGEFWYCPPCDGLFDDDPDEGSDYSDYDPSWRLQREEQWKGRRR